ncbi:MAG TPA: DUF2853 family protein [Methylophilaceae bacterium]|nr:DUF2853 family protein [Methylophilaceae bacterium]HPX88848.1 DUF2853 family protein [Methylophilaceae bacterium]HQC28048.1 DUF2853 family protein [Methylotenera sp.]HQO16807.1 DUF2853 family protein [Methylotenera sp.]
MADIQEHKATVAKYVKNLNTAALDGLAKNYALVLSNKDSQYVAATDESERITVRENFLKKKLGLTNSDAELDAAVEAVGAVLKDEHFKSRLAYYYILAEKYNKLDLFIK